MNFIYDIVLNFNEKYFDFYDWNYTDDIVEIKKIPIFSVDSKTYNDLLSSKFRLDHDFLNRIYNKCEIYTNKSIKCITAFLITDTTNITAFKINKKINYSSLQVDDELDILDDLNIPISVIKYKVLGYNKKILKTRNQILNESYIKDTLAKIIEENNISKLKYIYYECFNKKENRVDVIKMKLSKVSDNNEINNRLFNVLSSINS